MNVSTQKVADYVSDVDVLRQRMPERINNLVEGISDIRSAYEYAKRVNSAREAVGLSKNGIWFHAATIPVSVITALEALDPEFIKDKRKFYPWLARHPQYRTGKIHFLN